MAINHEAFVYCWTNHSNQMLYVGVHRGAPDDGYVCSSKTMLEDYENKQHTFTRQIVASGSLDDMRKFESAILQAANAAENNLFYNKHNNNGKFFCNSHTDKTKQKMSKTWKLKKVFNCSNEKAIASWVGKKHSSESKAKMSSAQKKHSNKRSNFMTSYNPMKNKDSINKMLETRKKNREAKNGNAS